MRRLYALGFVLIVLSLSHTITWASDVTQFYRMPTTLDGSSGLLLTQSIDTLNPGKLEVGLGGLNERSSAPDYSDQFIFATATFGLGPSIEASAQIPYISASDKTGKDETGEGDIHLALKWRIFDPSTEINIPGFALSFTAFLPTGDLKTGTGEVESWGLKVLMISSAELEISFFSQHFLMGSYANWGVYIQDPGDPTEEKHGIANLGFLFPLNETRQFQFLLEASVRVKREVKFPSPRNEDYTGITPSFRFLSKRLAFTLGWQHRLKDAPNKNSSLVIFNWSYYF